MPFEQQPPYIPLLPLPPEASKIRLDRSAYEQLVKQCPIIAVNNETSAQQAGFQLGAHYVLQKLRDGFVVGL